jgi:hypothetical protein
MDEVYLVFALPVPKPNVQAKRPITIGFGNALVLTFDSEIFLCRRLFDRAISVKANLSYHA